MLRLFCQWSMAKTELTLGLYSAAPVAVGRDTKNEPSGASSQMGDREVDQQLVERAQRGDKRAFDLLVIKYQRKLGRLLSRFIRDPSEIDDVAQEAFIKAYRALPSFRGDSAFYTWLYRIGINTAKNFLVAAGRRAISTTDLESADQDEPGDHGPQISDMATPETLMMSRLVAEAVNASMESMPNELRTAKLGQARIDWHCHPCVEVVMRSDEVAGCVDALPAIRG